jgi:hypothetical protein
MPGNAQRKVDGITKEPAPHLSVVEVVPRKDQPGLIPKDCVLLAVGLLVMLSGMGLVAWIYTLKP